MGKFEREEARCPFYAGERGAWISCEGVMEESLSTHVIFADKKSRAEAAVTLCCGDWEECPLARAINRKYEE